LPDDDITAARRVRRATNRMCRDHRKLLDESAALELKLRPGRETIWSVARPFK
jgi:hypothetical protein